MARVLNRHGLTLAEILISLGLATVALLSVIALSISALRTQHKSSDVVVAQGYADEILERFVYSLPPSTDGFWSETSFSNPYQQDSIKLGGQTFESQLQLIPQGGGQGGLMRCSVKVSWQSGETGQAGQGRQTVEALRLIYAH